MTTLDELEGPKDRWKQFVLVIVSKSYRLLHLNLVDFDAEQFVSEVVIEVEAVSVLHFFPSGIFI